MVGGLHPKWRSSTTSRSCARSKAKYPGMQIKAWTAVEIDWFTRSRGKSIEQVLDRPRRGGARLAARRRRRGVQRARRRNCSSRRSAPIAGSRSIASRTAWASARTRRSSSATSRPTRSASCTCCACATSGRGAAASSRSSRSRSSTATRSLVERAGVRARGPAHDRDVAARVRQRAAREVVLGDARRGDRADRAQLRRVATSTARSARRRSRTPHSPPSPLGLARERLIELIREAGKTPVERDALYNEVDVVAHA